MKKKVDLSKLEQPGDYPDMFTKLARELATEIERKNNPDYVSVSWASQEEAQNYFNEHGFQKTLTHTLQLRAQNDDSEVQP